MNEQKNFIHKFCFDSMSNALSYGEDLEKELTDALNEAGLVIVRRALVIEAAKHAEMESADPYEDISDFDLAAKLRACVNQETIPKEKRDHDH